MNGNRCVKTLPCRVISSTPAASRCVRGFAPVRAVEDLSFTFCRQFPLLTEGPRRAQLGCTASAAIYFYLGPSHHVSNKPLRPTGIAKDQGPYTFVQSSESGPQCVEAAGQRYLIETSGASDANARLMKMSVIEKTIPKTSPVTTVFMEGSLIDGLFRNISNACLNLYTPGLAQSNGCLNYSRPSTALIDRWYHF
jgi:hypothetical protein